MRRYFTKSEAMTKVGKRIWTLTAWSGVPKGTTGRVIKADPMGGTKPVQGDREEIWDVVIEWDLSDREKPLQDWFTKNEYDTHVQEITEAEGQA